LFHLVEQYFNETDSILVKCSGIYAVEYICCFVLKAPKKKRKKSWEKFIKILRNLKGGRFKIQGIMYMLRATKDPVTQLFMVWYHKCDA
jgi:hypothetical protein